jgi:CARDB
MWGSDSAHRHATAELVRCAPSRHKAAFSGRMTRVDGTARMSMRFTLLEWNGERYLPVRSRKLARWHSSLSGVDAFVYTQRVRGLPSGSAYRALVRFRWYSPSGDVLWRARRRSPACRLRGPWPNLRVVRIRELGELNNGRAASYAVRVANLGGAPASSAQITLFVDGAAVDTVDAGRLESGATGRATFVGPRCERWDSPVLAVVDPNHRVHESRERDNRLATSCSNIR